METTVSMQGKWACFVSQVRRKGEAGAINLNNFLLSPKGPKSGVTFHLTCSTLSFHFDQSFNIFVESLVFFFLSFPLSFFLSFFLIPFSFIFVFPFAFLFSFKQFWFVLSFFFKMYFFLSSFLSFKSIFLLWDKSWWD